MADRKPRITKEMQSRFLRLAGEAKPPREAEEVGQRRKELLAEVAKYASKAFPAKEMKILEKHGCTRVPDGIELRARGNGDNCSCSKVVLSAEGSLKRPWPRDENNSGAYGRPVIEPQEGTLLHDLVQAYGQALDALENSTKPFKKALTDLVWATLVPGKPLDRLDALAKAWPDPKVKELVKNIKAGELPMEAKKAQAVVAEAYT